MSREKRDLVRLPPMGGCVLCTYCTTTTRPRSDDRVVGELLRTDYPEIPGNEYEKEQLHMHKRKSGRGNENRGVHADPRFRGHGRWRGRG